MAFDGGKDGNIAYRSRQSMKVGGKTSQIYRAAMILSPSPTIQKTLSTLDGYTAGIPYSILNGTLTLTAKSGTTGENLYCFMLPLGSTIDESISWSKPSAAYTTTWKNYGGDIEPLAENIAVEGRWDNNKVSFDITPYMSIWQNSGKPNFAISITGTETKTDVTLFHSKESANQMIGGSALTNCRFLSGGDVSTIQTEGIRVQMVPSGNNVVVTGADTNSGAMQRWRSANASVAIGATMTVFSPDSEQGLVIGTVTATVVDKSDTQSVTSLVLSGISLGGITAYYTTAEFSSVSPLPTGTGIIEISNPNTQTLTDIAALVNNEKIAVNYLPSTVVNNVRTYTVNFTADETLKLNRARIYLNETAVSENRNGGNTELRTSDNQPKITLELLV